MKETLEGGRGFLYVDKEEEGRGMCVAANMTRVFIRFSKQY